MHCHLRDYSLSMKNRPNRPLRHRFRKCYTSLFRLLVRGDRTLRAQNLLKFILVTFREETLLFGGDAHGLMDIILNNLPHAIKVH